MLYVGRHCESNILCFAQLFLYSVATWEEPYDSALYCVRSDGNNAFLVGTARHGMVRLWDKRKKLSVQVIEIYHSTVSRYLFVLLSST